MNEPQLPPSTARLPQLDGLRGVAILLVMLSHFCLAIDAQPGSFLSYVKKALLLSWSGVDLFFVLSGFLIGGILLDQRRASNYFKVFYIRRFWRIVPLYAAVLLLGFATNPASIEQTVGPLAYLTFTQNIGLAMTGDWHIMLPQSWSLAVEEQFYLVLPALLLLVPGRFHVPVVVSLVLTAIVVRLLAFAILTPKYGFLFNYVMLPARMDALFLGVLVALAYRDPEWWQRIAAARRSIVAVLALSFTAMACFTFNGWSVLSPAMSVVGFSLVAVAYTCLLIVALVERQGVVHWILTRPAVMNLGVWAYFLYLLHISIPNHVFSAAGRGFRLSGAVDYLLLAASVVVLLRAARVSWRYFELPGILFGRRWSYRQPPASAF